jgi:hypothetical protein
MRGRFAQWPEKSLEDAVATWMVRYSDPVWGPPSKTHLLKIKDAAEELREEPWKHFEVVFRRMDDAPPWYTFEEQWFSSYVADIRGTEEYVLLTPHQLVSRWLAAVEKVRHKAPLRSPAIVVYDWNIDGSRDSTGRLCESKEFEYTFNRAAFETYSHSRLNEQVWEPGQYWSGQDKVYIFFKVPEFKQDPLEFVIEQFLG